MNRFLMQLGLGIVLAGSAIADEADLERLNAARERWESVQTANYVYRYQRFCECYPGEPPVTVVSVTDGQVVRVFHLHAGSEREVPAPEGSLSLYWTIDELFDKLDGAYAADAIVRAEYDTGSGFPSRLFIDYDAGFDGDETDLQLNGVEFLR